jgi:hypothetical protein
MKPAAVLGSLNYPANRLGWLHKFCSLLVRAEVAREIGRDAMLLILAIAVQEDALKYGSAPIFFDSELQRLTGIRSLKQLGRIRQKAVDAGWLSVVRSRDGDQNVAQYWTLIPQRLNVFDNPAVVCVGTDIAAVQHKAEPCGKEVAAGQAVAHQASIVQDGVPSGVTGAITGPCPPKVLSPSVGPPADAELEARAGSAGASPSRAPGLMELNTPAVTVLAATNSVPTITVFAKAAVVAQLPRQSVAVAAVPKRLSEYPPLIRQQAGDLLTAYPSIRDLEQGLLSICRALEKIPYSQLRPLVNRYSVARNRPGQELRLTPSAATWFDEERWREGPHKWEIRDQDLLKKKA